MITLPANIDGSFSPHDFRIRRGAEADATGYGRQLCAINIDGAAANAQPAPRWSVELTLLRVATSSVAGQTIWHREHCKQLQQHKKEKSQL